MTKCDFCTKSDPVGKCYWDSQLAREDDCKRAIAKMVEAIKGLNKDNLEDMNVHTYQRSGTNDSFL